jgi:hypothetical protein
MCRHVPFSPRIWTHVLSVFATPGIAQPVPEFTLREFSSIELPWRGNSVREVVACNLQNRTHHGNNAKKATRRDQRFGGASDESTLGDAPASFRQPKEQKAESNFMKTRTHKGFHTPRQIGQYIHELTWPRRFLFLHAGRILSSAGIALALLSSPGCAGPDHMGVTNQQHPGPALGRVVGTGVGAVGGNVAGVVVGAGEGVAAGAKAPFDNTTRVVRRWRMETTSDGRTIQVPEEIIVDQYGRPVGTPAGK